MTVEGVVAKVFQLDEDEINDDCARGRIAAWDSMGHLSLITALEVEFKIRISISDAMEMGSISQIKERLKKYGVSND